MERVSHWSEDRYWTDALLEIYRMRETGRTHITLDLRAIDDVAFDGEGPAYKLMDAMRSVWELEGYEGFRGAPRVMLAASVRLQEISDSARGEASAGTAFIPQAIEAFNRFSAPQYRIATELGPCFYEGAGDAPVVLLTLNPGFDRTSTIDDHRVRLEGWPLAGLHPSAPKGLHKWWTDRVSQLAKVVPVQTIAQRLQSIPLFPWAIRSLAPQP